ncbi:MAG: hypothetical protein HY929_00210 [Euryarchaeota archaeon]|nr:hypothetical protein [Euryarchaeota archaeon]
MNIELVRTGNAEFDVLCGGGIPKGSVIMFNQDPGAYAYLLAMQYLVQGLKEGDACVYVTYDHPPSWIKNEIKRFTPDLEKYENFIIVDAYTPSFRPEHMKPSNEKFFIEKPRDLTRISLQVNSLIDELIDKGYKNIRWVFDSFTTLMLISDNSTGAIMLGRSLLGRIHEVKHTGISIFAHGMFPHEIETTNEHILDGVVDLRSKEIGGKLQRTLRVRKLSGAIHSTEEVPYEVTEAGIALGKMIAQDFQFMKEHLTLGIDGTLTLFNTKVLITPADLLSVFYRKSCESFGLARVNELMYNVGFTDSYNFAKFMSGSMKLKGTELIKTYLESLTVRGWGKFEVVHLDLERGEAFIRDHHCSFCSPLVDLSREVCFILDGAMAGIFSFVTGKEWKFIETKCIAKKDEYCELKGNLVTRKL